MKRCFSTYRYFKGEKINPFHPEEQNAAHQFWEYERLFYENHTGSQADQEKQFKEWLYSLLMDYLPGKYETGDDHFLKLYWKS